MFRLFGKIRYQLLATDRLRRYASYAFGEIILVVIGILIALQINNWNEKRRDTQHLKEYFSTIVRNLNEDIETLSMQAEYRDKLRADNKKAAYALINKQHDIQLYTNAHRYFYEFYFIPSDHGYQALLNSGLTSRFANTDLDERLHSYYVLLKQIHSSEESLNNFIEQVESNFRLNYPALTFGLITRAINAPDSYLMEPDQVDKLLARKDELMPYYLSKEFEAGVLRAAAQGTGRYYQAIEEAKALKQELEEFIQK